MRSGAESFHRRSWTHTAPLNFNLRQGALGRRSVGEFE